MQLNERDMQSTLSIHVAGHRTLQKKRIDIHQEIECCFHICNNYWGQVRERLIHYEFNTRHDEIEFFKIIKPLFTSQIEYYGLIR